MTEAQQRDYDRLYKQMQDFGGKYDQKLIKKAFEYCVLKHDGQKRQTNEDYYIHPFNVALIIVSLVMDSESIAAALLHDVVEDTDATIDDIKREFGDEVALLVDGVTKIGRLNFTTKEQQQAESLRKCSLRWVRYTRNNYKARPPSQYAHYRCDVLAEARTNRLKRWKFMRR
ncbi:MAG: HD domain-containing protein [Oscillospiraceae bacterium]